MLFRMAAMPGGSLGILEGLCGGLTPVRYGESEVYGGVPSYGKLKAVGIDLARLFSDLPEDHRTILKDHDFLMLSLLQTRSLGVELCRLFGDNVGRVLGLPNVNGAVELFKVMGGPDNFVSYSSFAWGWVGEPPKFEHEKFVADLDRYGAAAVLPLNDLKLNPEDPLDLNKPRLGRFIDVTGGLAVESHWRKLRADFKDEFGGTVFVVKV